MCIDRSLRFAPYGFLLGALAVYPVLAAPPQVIRYQASLTDDAAVPLVATHDLGFAIYDAPAGGLALWSESRPALDLGTTGVLDILLGTVTVLPSSVFTTSDRWLEVVVDGAALSPRHRLSSVPYAHAADRLGDKTLADVLASGEDSLDDAYDRGGPGAGRTIIADAGAVHVAGPHGLHVDGNVGIGTPTPSAKLDVAGSATVNQLMVTSTIGSTATPAANTLYADNLVKAWAAVGAAGNLESGFNLTVSYVTTGMYDYTFKLPMNDNDYAVILSTHAGSQTTAHYLTRSTTGFQVMVLNDSGNATNMIHSVLVLGIQ
jgi:hypothetical protein